MRFNPNLYDCGKVCLSILGTWWGGAHVVTPVDSAYSSCHAVLVDGGNGDGAWRCLVTIVEFTHPRPCIYEPLVYGRLVYTVIHMSDRLLTQAHPYPHLPPPTISA